MIAKTAIIPTEAIAKPEILKRVIVTKRTPRKQNTNLLLRLNDIMTVTNHELDNFGGHMRQYIVDDKGVRLDFPDPPFRTW